MPVDTMASNQDFQSTPSCGTTSLHTAGKDRAESLIDELPGELVRMVCSISGILDCVDLKALRLTRRVFNPTATSILFNQLPLSRLKTCRDAFFNVSATPHLANHVETLVWYELCNSFDELDGVEKVHKVETDEDLPRRLTWMLQNQNLFWRSFGRQTDAFPDVSAADAAQVTADVFRAKFMTALDQMPNLTTFISAPMPPTTVLASTERGYHLTAYHARSLSHGTEYFNDGFFEFLVPALNHLGPLIKTMAFMDESATYMPRDAKSQTHFHSAAFSHLTSIHLTLDCHPLSESALMSCVTLAESLQAADNLEVLTLALKSVHAQAYQPFYTFFNIFLRDAKTKTTKKWGRLRSLGLEGFGVTSDELMLFVRTHADTLRHLILRDCMTRSTLVPALAGIDGLLLSSFRVEVSDGLTTSGSEPCVSIKEEAILRFVNHQTPHNPMIEGAKDIKVNKQGFLFSTSFRKWLELRNVFEDNRDNPDTNSESNSDHEYPDSVCEQTLLSSQDAEYIEPDDSDTVWRNPPHWTWGRFYHKNPDEGEVYYWQVDASEPKSYRTRVWKGTRNDGDVVFYDASRGPMEPPEEVFEDWDSDAGDMIEPTPWRTPFELTNYNCLVVREQLEMAEHLLGPGHWGFWEELRKREPPPDATLYNETDDPEWLVSNGLAHRTGRVVQIQLEEEEVIGAEDMQKEALEAQTETMTTMPPSNSVEIQTALMASTLESW